MVPFRKRALRTFGIALVTIAICVLLLVVSAFLPQNRIHENFRKSLEFLSSEGLYPSVGDRMPSSQLDNFTDSIILLESDVLQKSALENLWYCPVNHVDEPDFENAATKTIQRFLNDDMTDMQPYYYVRYWMGFRAPMRFLLTFFNYSGIRRILSAVVFIFIALTAYSINRYTQSKYAFAFLLSVILVKPAVFSQSVTCSCCFIIAPLAMLFIPSLYRSKRFVFTFFMVVGMVTQFFDFYTTPIITLCYPLLYYLLLVQRYEKPRTSDLVKFILKVSGMWLLGYVFMWLVKLGLTTIFTDVNGFADGFFRFLEWNGVPPPTDSLAGLTIFDMLKAVAISIFRSKRWALLFALIFVLLTIILLLCIKRKKILIVKATGALWGFLLVAVLPLIWFCVAKRPTYVHAWFQYRSVCVLYFGLLCAILSRLRRPAFSPHPGENLSKT